MLEIVIERWQGLDGRAVHRWSVWLDGRRVDMGGPHGDPEACLEEAQLFCQEALGRAADRVTRL